MAPPFGWGFRWVPSPELNLRQRRRIAGFEPEPPGDPAPGPSKARRPRVAPAPAVRFQWGPPHTVITVIAAFVLLSSAAIGIKILGAGASETFGRIPVPIVTQLSSNWTPITPHVLTCPTHGGEPRFVSDAMCGHCETFVRDSLGSRALQFLVEACRRVEVCVTCTTKFSTSYVEETSRVLVDRPPEGGECASPAITPKEASCSLFWKTQTCFEEVQKSVLEVWKDPFTDSWVGPGGSRVTGSGWQTFQDGWVANIPTTQPITTNLSCCLVDAGGKLGVTFGTSFPLDLSTACQTRGWLSGPGIPTFKFHLKSAANHSYSNSSTSLGTVGSMSRYFKTALNRTGPCESNDALCLGLHTSEVFRGDRTPSVIMKFPENITYNLPHCPADAREIGVKGLSFGSTLWVAMESVRSELTSLICELALDVAVEGNVVTPTLLSLMWGGYEGHAPLVRLCPGGVLEFATGNVSVGWGARFENGTITAVSRQLETNITGQYNTTGQATQIVWKTTNVSADPRSLCGPYGPFGVKCHASGVCDSPLARASAARGYQDRNLELHLSYVNGSKMVVLASPVRRAARKTYEYIGPTLDGALDLVTRGAWGVFAAVTKHIVDFLIVVCCAFVCLLLIKWLIHYITSPARAQHAQAAREASARVRADFKAFMDRKKR